MNAVASAGSLTETGIAAKIGADAVIAGLGESTRFSTETFVTRDRLFRILVSQHGFRALAVQDDAAVAARQDEFVNGGPGTPESALDGAWRPWRTAEMAAALAWIRRFNDAHPQDPVRIFGVQPARAQPADYDAVLDGVRELAPGRVAELGAHLAPIRTAHETDEHVQRARGFHPGRPFAEHARDAFEIVESVGAQDDLLARMRLIVTFHETSVAGRGSFVGDDEGAAATIGDFQGESGLRVVYWDGIAHTAATPVTSGLAPGGPAKPTIGSLLREQYGDGYVSVGIGFHHGNLGVATVPAPAADFADAKLEEGWLDLRDETVRKQWREPTKVRVISGVYDPARDTAEHIGVPALAAAFDAFFHVREATAVRWLP
ncbi:erythromycin esterase family protein [Amycolatopsis sp.]|uniref:erythromycin esterase family protein n=1 Tax=Amycolatopsis sp. TaxID=37632 RepID=UPI002BEB49A0|nr:erythromycin esterase family protein [Amycolatopsis sp.]HVV13882.1 erythromycin esterase family protein [Amycolatopsis sp.]